MKNYALLTAAIFIISANSAHAQAYEAGQVTVSAGYGFPNFTRTLFNITDNVSNLESQVIGPVYGKFEYAVNDIVGFGVNIAYTNGIASYTTADNAIDSIIYNTHFNYNAYSVLGRLNFHFGNADMIDPYAGIGLGYRNTKYSYESEDPNFDGANFSGFNHFGLDFTMGARFYFTDNFGIYGEIGVAKTPLQVGVVAKF